MKNVVLAAAAGIVTVCVATTLYAADLPRRTPAPAPVFTQAPLTGFYAGVNGGAAWTKGDADGVFGGTVGYEFNPFLRAEVNGIARTGVNSGQAVTVDGIVGVPVNRFTPYAFVGLGAGFNGLNTTNRNTEALWTAGGGVRYSVTQNWELDARYRHIQNFDGTLRNNDITTLGVNYKF